MSHRLVAIVVGCVALLLCTWAILNLKDGVCCELRVMHAELNNQFDTRYPGRGVTDYPGNTVEDVAKGYAMVLKAEVLAAETGVNAELSEMGRNAAVFLLASSDDREDGFPGWGVPVAWDPYGDGSINPRDTKYTISTAIVADALLDWIQYDDTAPREEVVALLEMAFLPYTKLENLSPSGLLPYSLEPVDRRYSTFNPAGYLAGVMQRFSHLVSDLSYSEQLRDVADKTVRAHLSHVKETDAGGWYWSYSISEDIPNDLAHAGYIVHGLRLYAEHGGTYADQLDLASIDAHLSDFAVVNEDGVPEAIMAWPVFREDTNTPARSYGLGMGLYLSCLRQSSRLQEYYLAALPRYRLKAGGYAKYPTRSGYSELVVREYEAYVLLGITACLSKEDA